MSQWRLLLSYVLAASILTVVIIASWQNSHEENRLFYQEMREHHDRADKIYDELLAVLKRLEEKVE